MKNITLLLTLLFTSLSFLGFSQSEISSEWCGTQFTEAMMDQVQSATERHLNGTSTKSNITYDIPLTLHNMRNTSGTAGIEPLITLEVFCEVIDFYAQHDINIYINEMKTHDNTNWTTDAAMGTIKFLTAEDNTINIYNFKELFNQQGDPLCGYFTPQHDVLALAGGGGCYTKETIIHEIGHYFGLPHTFFGFEGTGSNCGVYVSSGERVDGSNCATAADRICDTPPDNSADRIPCPNGTGCQMFDRDGVAFFADPTNIMSYFFDECLSRFTDGQRAVMHNKIDEDRQDLLVLTPPENYNPVSEVVGLNSPLDIEKPYDQVLFTWDATENATLYYFEINRVASFSTALRVESAITEETQYTSFELNPNTTYHWRVMPFNRGNPCTTDDAIGSGSFTTTGDVVAIEDVEGLQSFEVSPNPVNSNQPITIALNSSKSMAGQLDLYSVSGQRIHSEAIRVAAADNTFNLDVQGLAAGLYVVHLQFADGAVQQKLIIQ